MLIYSGIYSKHFQHLRILFYDIILLNLTNSVCYDDFSYNIALQKSISAVFCFKKSTNIKNKHLESCENDRTMGIRNESK